MRWSLLLLCLTSLPMTGCHRSLFSEDLPRHQFEDYDASRTGPIPAEETDEFGHPKPNLRRRLGGS
ncbi:MAG: hypothetical protein MK101_11210 [Phycisphaerales bacterium]|nr:hypothetical protein [Phycisphaerales bacterium]